MKQQEKALTIGQKEIPFSVVESIDFKKNLFTSTLLITLKNGTIAKISCKASEAQKTIESFEDFRATRESQERQEILKAHPHHLEALLLDLLQKSHPRVFKDLVDTILEAAILQSASDIHLLPSGNSLNIQFRLFGELKKVATLPLTCHPNLMVRLKVLAKAAVYQHNIPQEGRFSYKAVELRLSIIPSVEGEKVALRLFNHQHILTFPQLGFESTLQKELLELLSTTSGVFLISGSCGSGKTTTLYALLRELQQLNPGANIVTIEEPVEQKIEGITQTEVMEHHDLSIANGLKRLLRQDPNIIMVGEIRDVEVAQIVIQAGLTGHLVLSTIHTGSHLEVITRLLDMGIESYQLASALKGVLSQELKTISCLNCQEKGCPSCFDSGFIGRTARGELLVISDAMRTAIMEKQNVNEMAKLLELSQNQEEHLLTQEVS